MKEPSQIHTPQPESDEIDLIALAGSLWNGRMIILKSILICGIIGLIVALNSPNEYVANTIMVPSGNSPGSSLGELGGLAAIAGINLNTNSGSDLAPSVYPQIVASLPYQLELMKTLLNFSDRKEQVTFYDYYSNSRKENLLIKYTIGLPRVIMGIPGAIMSALKGKNLVDTNSVGHVKPLKITDKQQSVRQILYSSISLTVNPKDGIITLSAKMSEAQAAAQLAQQAQELLQQYITEFKIKKAKANLDFIQQRYDETSQKFESAQQLLASFRDRNKSVTLAIAKTEEERLTSQYNLIYSIYSELAKQLEQAKIQVKQDTPVFTIIEPVSVPVSKSKPNRQLILIFWLFLGGVIGISLVTFMKPIKNLWRNEI